MSRVRKTVPQPIALLGSDLHLSHECPVARMCESSWYGAMREVLRFMGATADKYNVELVLAGDIFHHYREPPELINFALQHMPQAYAIPGQHDLPFHNLEHVHKSAYYTLTNYGKLFNLPSRMTCHGRRSANGVELWLYGFPWGTELDELSPPEWSSSVFRLAVVHHYVWLKGHTHPGATEETYCETLRKKLRGFNAAVFGDNHSRFVSNGEDPYPTIINTGCLMRRRMDEAAWRPSLTLLFDDGSYEAIELPIDNECIAATPTNPYPAGEAAVLDAAELLAELKDAGYVGQDFRLALRMAVQLDKEITPAARRILQEVLDKNAGS